MVGRRRGDAIGERSGGGNREAPAHAVSRNPDLVVAHLRMAREIREDAFVSRMMFGIDAAGMTRVIKSFRISGSVNANFGSTGVNSTR